MRARLIVLGVCSALMIVSATSVLATLDLQFACCESNGDCADMGGRCCEPESIGMPPCSLEMPGQCMARCQISNGGQ